MEPTTILRPSTGRVTKTKRERAGGKSEASALVQTEQKKIRNHFLNGPEYRIHLGTPKSLCGGPHSSLCLTLCCSTEEGGRRWGMGDYRKSQQIQPLLLVLWEWFWWVLFNYRYCCTGFCCCCRFGVCTDDFVEASWFVCRAIAQVCCCCCACSTSGQHR